MANPKLVCLTEQFRGKVFELTEDIHSLGRVPERDICLVDSTISGHHADLIRNEDGSYTVKDHGSTNGSRINGKFITEQVLVNTDILRVGAIEMFYDCEDQSATSVIGKNVGEKTGIDIGGETIQINVGRNASPFGSTKGGPSKKMGLAVKLFVAVMILIAIGAAGFFIFSIMSSPNS